MKCLAIAAVGAVLISLCHCYVAPLGNPRDDAGVGGNAQDDAHLSLPENLPVGLPDDVSTFLTIRELF